jgi:UDP-N-acetylglucosamine:LPS N-acetylglucosamine transferase
MSPSVRAFSRRTADAASPSSTVVLVHSGSASVEETTYFGRPLILSAYSPSRDGHAATKPS